MARVTWDDWVDLDDLFSILPAFKKSVCSKLGETGRQFLSYRKIQITIYVENVNKKSLESIKAVNGKESPK